MGRYCLKVGAIDKTLTKLWKAIERCYRDRESVEGKNFQDIKLKLFRNRAECLYSKEAIDLWLEDYGLVKRVINRASHKKFNEDGSWTSNGVKFGP